MKCYKPGTDQEAEFRVLVNGRDCMEYEAPVVGPQTPDTLECFVSVKDGDLLSVKGHFQGSILHAAFDIIADGSFIGDKRIEGSKTGQVKYAKRDFTLDRFIDGPTEMGSSPQPYSGFVVGGLRVFTLHERVNGHNRVNLGVGSLAVVVSLNQRTENNYTTSYGTDRLDHSEKLSPAKTNSHSIHASHQLGIQGDGSERVDADRQAKHRRHFQQNRFGERPWATFVFHYRASATVTTTCRVSQQLPHTLTAATSGDFIKSKSYTLPRRRTSGSSQIEGRVRRTEGLPYTLFAGLTDRKNSIFVTPPPVEMMGDQKQKKRKSKGQDTSKERDQRPFSTVFPQHSKAGMHTEDLGRGERKAILGSEDFGGVVQPETDAHEASTSIVSPLEQQPRSYDELYRSLLSKLHNDAYGVVASSEEQVGDQPSSKKRRVRGPRDESTASPMTSQGVDKATFHPQPVQNSFIKQPADAQERVSSVQTRPNPTIVATQSIDFAMQNRAREKMPFEEIRRAIGQNGITARNLYMRFRPLNIAINAMFHRVEEVAVLYGKSYYLKDSVSVSIEGPAEKDEWCNGARTQWLSDSDSD